MTNNLYEKKLCKTYIRERDKQGAFYFTLYLTKLEVMPSFETNIHIS